MSIQKKQSYFFFAIFLIWTIPAYTQSDFDTDLQFDTKISLHPKPIIQTTNSTGNYIVCGSIGNGKDISDNYTFGYATLTIKDENIRMLFDDSDNSDVDWMFEVNGNRIESKNYFAIKDNTYNTYPFIVSANAPDNALYLDPATTGTHIGIGSNKMKKYTLSVYDKTSPALRMEVLHSGKSGIWDIKFDNDNCLRFSDMTNSGLSPFKLKWNAKKYSLLLKNDFVGINVGNSTVNKTHKLFVSGDTQIDGYLYIGEKEADGYTRISNIDGVLTFEIYHNGSWETALEME